MNKNQPFDGVIGTPILLNGVMLGVVAFGLLCYAHPKMRKSSYDQRAAHWVVIRIIAIVSVIGFPLIITKPLAAQLCFSALFTTFSVVALVRVSVPRSTDRI